MNSVIEAGEYIVSETPADIQRRGAPAMEVGESTAPGAEASFGIATHLNEPCPAVLQDPTAAFMAETGASGPFDNVGGSTAAEYAGSLGMGGKFNSKPVNFLEFVPREDIDLSQYEEAMLRTEGGTRIRLKLTKRLLYQLPAGAYITSNCHHDFFTPVFQERLGPLGTRGDTWRRVVAARANGRLCSCSMQPIPAMWQEVSR